METNKEKTLIQQAACKYIQEFVRQHPYTLPVENGSLAEQVVFEYMKRTEGNISDYIGTEKGNKFIIMLIALSQTI